MMEQQAAIDPELKSSAAVKAYRDTVRKEVAALQGTRDVNTVVVKAAANPSACGSQVSATSAASKGFQTPQR